MEQEENQINQSKKQQEEEVKIDDNEESDEELQYPFEQGIPKSYILKAQVDLDHLQCPICFNILWNPQACSQDKCFSSFCGPCIEKWLNKGKPNSTNQDLSIDDDQGSEFSDMQVQNQQDDDENSIFRVNNNLRGDDQHQSNQLNPQFSNNTQQHFLSQQQSEQTNYFDQAFQQDNQSSENSNEQDFTHEFGFGRQISNLNYLNMNRRQNNNDHYQVEPQQQLQIVREDDSDDDIGYSHLHDNLYSNRYTQPRQIQQIRNSNQRISEMPEFQRQLNRSNISIEDYDSDSFGENFQSYKNCPKCKRNYKKTTIPVINSLLSTLKMKCINYKNGCKEQVNYDFYEKHIKQCKFQKIECKGCKKKFIQEDYQQHEEVCESIFQNCPHCTIRLSRKQLKESHDKIECFQQQNNNMKKDLKKCHTILNQQTEKIIQQKEFIKSVLLGGPKSLKQFEFQTYFEYNYQFSLRQARLNNQCYNEIRKKNDFLHFYLKEKFFTQSLLSFTYEIILTKLEGSLLIGICNSLGTDSLDFIINTSGELKKKESNEQKYKFVSKTDFEFKEGDNIKFTYYPLQQRFELKNKTKIKTFSFRQNEIEQLGESFYCFFSLEKKYDCIQFM